MVSMKTEYKVSEAQSFSDFMNVLRNTKRFKQVIFINLGTSEGNSRNFMIEQVPYTAA